MYWPKKEGSACLPVDILRITTLTGWVAGNAGCCTAKRSSTQSLSNLLRVEYASYSHCLGRCTSHRTNPTHSSTVSIPSIPNCVAGSKSPPTAGGRVLVGRELCRECFVAAPHAWSAAELPKSDNQSASAPPSTPVTPSDLAKEVLSS
ncbi:hypothetical protein GQ54DRAFT_300884 [Martensiomyces pterosporus]|nr:hypothetical protein GQ54DRAFT_300884 [Martensiomyces pterosporus]